MAEPEKREEEMTKKVEKGKGRPPGGGGGTQKRAKRAFDIFVRGFFLFHFIGHPFVLFSGSVVPG